TAIAEFAFYLVSRVLGNGVPAEGAISASGVCVRKRALLTDIDAMELQLRDEVATVSQARSARRRRLCAPTRGRRPVGGMAADAPCRAQRDDDAGIHRMAR